MAYLHLWLSDRHLLLKMKVDADDLPGIFSFGIALTGDVSMSDVSESDKTI